MHSGDLGPVDETGVPLDPKLKQLQVPVRAHRPPPSSQGYTEVFGGIRRLLQKSSKIGDSALA